MLVKRWASQYPRFPANEPRRLDNADFLEDRLSRLMRQAIEQELITRDRVAEILRITPEEMIQRIGDWVG